MILTILFYIFCVLLLLAAISFFLPGGMPQSTIHGTARFARNTLLRRDNEGIIIDGRRGLPHNESFRHCLVVGATGYGKTQRYILPNVIMRDTSMVITDPKGEVHELCSGYLHDQGFQVLTLDFTNVANSLRYNPFIRVTSEAQVKNFVTALYDMTNAGVKTESIWRQGAIDIMEIILRCLINTGNSRYINLANFLRLMCYLEDKSNRIPDFIAKFAPDQSVKDRYAALMAQEEKPRSSKITTALSCLVPFDLQEIKELTATDDFDFTQFRKQKTALFMKVPVSGSGWSSPLLSLFYTQFFHHLLDTPLNHEDLPVYVLLEEFGNLRRLPSFEETITLIRSKKVSLSMILQNLSQLSQVYGHEAMETIIGNAASMLVYTGLRDDITPKKVQQLLGQATVETFALGQSHPTTTSRPLMTIDEIRTMPDHQALFIHGNQYGQKIAAMPAYKNPLLLQRAGLKSVDGQLVPNHAPYFNPPIRGSRVISYLPLDADGLDTKMFDLKERLNDILGKSEAV